MSSPATLPAASTARPGVPGAVTLSIAVWLSAILAGVVEALVHRWLPDPPSGGALAVRFGIYLVLAVLVLSLRSGRNAVRLAVALLLGGLGTLSLLVEPVTWLLDGGSPVAFLAAADTATLLATALRVLHLVAVAVALVLMFRPSASAFFARSGPGHRRVVD